MSLPVLALTLVEIGLRLAGYGYDPAFFQTQRDAKGEIWLVSNDAFTFRFFPPERSRCPAPFRFAAHKPADTIRIFILGESAAMGDPQPSVGPSRILNALLRQRFPGTDFEVINLGITAINSHVIVPIARDVAARGQGDIWILYLGNNEMVGPFGAATAFGQRAAPLWVVRLNLALQRTRVGQLAISALRHLGRKSPTAGWAGMQMFRENQLPPDDVRRATIHRHFARNLGKIVDLGLTDGGKIVLSTVAVNLRDCPPFGSLTGSKRLPTDRHEFALQFTNALAAQTSAPPRDAIAMFAQAAAIEPDFAELQFRWAQCLLAETNGSAARTHLQRACDTDALPFRADSQINAAIRALAQQKAGASLRFCDAEAAFAAAAPDGSPGAESFFEHVHFNFDGNYRLAMAWAEQVSSLLPSTIGRTEQESWATQEDCERAVGLSDWNRLTVIASVLARLQQAPFAEQFTNPRRRQQLRQEYRRISDQLRQADAAASTRAAFETALARTPEDNFLRENFAEFLKATGHPAAAIAEYQTILGRLPHDFYSAVRAGRMLGEMGRWADAATTLRSAATQRPFLPDAWFELGVVQFGAGDPASALPSFEQVLRLHPTDLLSRVYRARVLAKLSRQSEAIQEFQSLTRSHPERWDVHAGLAELFATSDRLSEAATEYQLAAKLNPTQPLVHINLGVVLARQNRLAEAREQLQIALQVSPTNEAAQALLREVLSRQETQRR
jgi:tetratricopeptide (TPR) repeat protein